jgi:hypothetical protein
MPRHHHPFGYNDDLQAEAVSATRPPQFNESTCGYRCGWGCCEPQGGDDGGGGNASEGTPTLIGSGEEDSMDWPVVQDGLDESNLGGSHSPRDVDGETNPLDLEDPFEQNSHLNRHFLTPDNMFASSQSDWDYDESLDSLEAQATGRSHGSVASDRRSIRSVSPCGWDAGIGDWQNLNDANPIPGHFRVTPLRLSPQYEHCRGPAASHMVTQDYSTLLDSVGEDWGVRMLVRGCDAEMLTRRTLFADAARQS